jgi:DNA repair protein RecN (Recombination protein N)
LKIWWARREKMLLEININNFALISQVSLGFEQGLNILTGETGAGKSIIIDALGVVLGGKASREMIRTGYDKASIEAIFDIETSSKCLNVLDKYGIDVEDDNTVLLSREIYSTGKTICKINGRTVTLSMLKYLSQYLVDIHGQNEHQALIDKSVHLDIIDQIGGIEITNLLVEIDKDYKQLKSISEELNNLRVDDQEKERKIDMLSFQLEEIEKTDPKPNEDEQLAEKKSILSNSEKIIGSLSNVYLKLHNGQQGIPSILDSLSNGLGQLQSVSKYDNKIEDISTRFESLVYQLQDICEEIRDYKELMGFDADQLEEVENRLYEINNLKRKYGKTIEEVLSYKDEIAINLNDIQNSEQRINALEKKLQELNEKLLEKAKVLSDLRKTVAKRLEKNLIGELVDLNMPKASFKVEFNRHNNVSHRGIDDVEFLVSTNAGEPPKSLIKVASGGEMSRIMLAFKTILAGKDSTPTIIFDEIDTGISGRTAQIVAEKMNRISKHHQILCITHLPQIASMGDCHFYIEKNEIKGKTIVQVNKLEYHQRINEISRLIGGTDVTELTLNNAKEILDLAHKNKENM